jgi:hypothetical protein
MLLIAALIAALIPAAPADAGGAQEVHGYVLATQPNTANYIANNGYQFNSTGGVVEITRTGTGRYTVRFEGMGTPGGMAHVQRYGSLSAAMCTVTSWGQLFGGPDLYVYVRCFTNSGTLSDSKFVAYFTNRSVTEGRFGYLWTDHVSGGPYDANAAYSYDSTGEQITYTHHDVGVYKVYMNAVLGLDGTPDLGRGQLQVTAYNTSAVRCTIAIEQDDNPIALTVVCRDAQGDLTDTRFVASFSLDVSHLGTLDPSGSATVVQDDGVASVPFWSSTGGAPTATRVDTGVYQVRFASLGVPKGNAIVSAMGSFQYCYLHSWLSALGGDEVVNVRCFDQLTLMSADIAFTVAFAT